MTTEILKQRYQEQLVKAGVEPERAMQVAANMTPEELQLISEIWVEWAEAIDRVALDNSTHLVELVEAR